jgi:hypothetical protein
MSRSSTQGNKKDEDEDEDVESGKHSESDSMARGAAKETKAIRRRRE